MKGHAIETGDFAIASDPRDPTLAPTAEVPPPQFNFAPLLNAVDTLTRAADAFENAYGAWSHGSDTAETVLRGINEQLVKSERDLTSPAGLPRRPWYRHLLYAPGYYTGYGVKTMPGAREAIEQDEWGDVNAQIARIADALMAEAALVNNAASALGRAK